MVDLLCADEVKGEGGGREGGREKRERKRRERES